MKYALTLLSIVLSSFTFAQGNCSEEDLAWMAANQDLLAELGSACGIDCAFAGDTEACVFDCMTSSTPLTNLCIDCFVGQVSCAQSNCLFTCLLGSAEDCATCISEFCLDDFNTCAGIYDEDDDTWSTLSDCDDTDATIFPGAVEIWYDGVDQNCDGLSDFDQDMDGEDSAEYGGTDCNDLDETVQGGLVTYYTDGDMDGYGHVSTAMLSCFQPPNSTTMAGDCNDADATMYPGAPGTASGIDNNCNGTLELEEEYNCFGDFNGDGARNTPDMLALLGEFGCVSGCATDLTGDDESNTNDILAFLGVFGVSCD